MKKLTIMLAGLGMAAAAIPAAASAQYAPQRGPQYGQGYGAQNWQTINQRQRNLDARIDQGVRSGQLTRTEAARLRTEFRNLANLEARYRRGGLSNWERRDLDQRFDRLSAKIRIERRDRDNRNDHRRH